MADMDLSSVIPTVVGGVLALGGGLLGSWLSDRRAAAREESGRVHERTVWARDHRHEAEVTFIREFQQHWTAVKDFEQGHGPEPDADEEALQHVTTAIQLLSSPKTQWRALSALVTIDGYRAAEPKDRATAEARVDSALTDFKNQVRMESGLGPISLDPT